MIGMLDVVAVAYGGISAARGAQRGAGEEGYRLVRLAVGLLAGSGLFALVNSLIASLLSSTTGDAGALGFVGGVVITFLAMTKLRKGIVDVIERALDEKHDRLGGAVAGCARALLAVFALVAFLQMLPFLPAGKVGANDSLIGKLTSVIVPADADDTSR